MWSGVPQVHQKLHRLKLDLVLTRVAVEQRYRQSKAISAQYAQEKIQTEAQNQDCEGSLRHAFKAKKRGNAEREVAFDLRNALTDNTHAFAEFTANCNLCLLEQMSFQKQIDAGMLTLNHIDGELKRQVILISGLQTELERMDRQMHNCLAKSSALEKEIALLAFLAEGMKKEIRDRDRELVDQRLRICELLASAEETSEAVAQLEHVIADLNEQIDAVVLKITAQAHTKNQLGWEVDTLTKGNRNVLTEMAAIQTTISRRTKEHSLLFAKVQELQGYCRMQAARFPEKLSEIAGFERELRIALDHQRELMLSRKRVDLMEKESFRLDRMYFKASAQLTVLSQEAEHPMNVHRWTMLETSNPKLYVLIQLRNSLLNETHTRGIVLKRLQNKLSIIKNDMFEFERAVANQTPRHTARASDMVETLNRRTRDMKLLEQQTEATEALIAQQRQVDEMREMVHLRKVETSENHHIIAELRAAIQMPSAPPVRRAPGRFKMGGGFTVGDAPVIADLPKLDLTRSASDRGRLGKPISITVPHSSKPARPKTFMMSARNKMRAYLSSRFPDENL
jgi:hypothetical protein